MVSKSYYPARGLKPDIILQVHHRAHSFQILLPRKGTETFNVAIKKMKVSSFQILLPRKGTETSEHSLYSRVLSRFQILLPRKGTETDRTFRASFAPTPRVSKSYYPARGLKQTG